MASVICPYCDEPAELVDSSTIYGVSYGLAYLCEPCDAYVGVHKDSWNNAPKGTLANAELRAWRKKAHEVFDPLWMGEEPRFTRREAYELLRGLLGLPPTLAHIGCLDIDQCRTLVSLVGTL